MDDTANHFDSPQSPDRPTPAPDDGWAASLDAGPRLARIRTARGGRPGAGRRAARHGLAWAVTGRAGLVVAAAVALTAVVNLPISHSTGPNPMGVVVLPPTGLRPAAMALAAFHSCPDLQAGLRSHAAAVVGPYGLPGTGSGPIYAVDAAPAGVASEASAANASAVPDHSTTNIHEVGVDEPDVVKTDGRRIVSVVGGVLRVVDTATRTVTGTLRLTPPTGPSALDLVLAGDRALVLAPAGDYPGVPLPGPAIDVPPGRPATEAGRYRLVDLSGEPRLIGSFSANGSYVDARLVGSTVRLVVRSTPAVRITPDLSGGIDETQLLARARQAVRGAPLSAWLPG